MRTHARGPLQVRHRHVLRRRDARHRLVGQDAAAVGCRDRPVRADDGHPVGDQQPAHNPDVAAQAPSLAPLVHILRLGAVRRPPPLARWHPQPQRDPAEPLGGRHWPVCRAHAAVRGRHVGHVPRLCGRRAVLGLRARVRLGRRRGAHVGHADGPGAPHACGPHGASHVHPVRRAQHCVGQSRQDDQGGYWVFLTGQTSTLPGHSPPLKC